jgi:hypothetical protein
MTADAPRTAEEASLARLGRAACFGLAAAYLASGLSAALMPPELQGRPEITPHEFWTALARDPAAHLAYHWSFVAAGVFGLAAVPVASLRLRAAGPGALLWSGAAAWLGFAVMARSHLMEIAFDRKIIPVYEAADPAFQAAVHVVAGLALDVPDGFLTYGAIGAWMLAVSALGWRARRLPPALCALGVAAAATAFAGVLGYTLLSRPLLVLSIGLGGALLVPAWWIGLGLALRPAQRASPDSRSA